MTDHITIPIDVAEAVAEAIGNFVSDHGWSDSDMQAMDNLISYTARHKANQAARDKLAKPAEREYNSMFNRAKRWIKRILGAQKP